MSLIIQTCKRQVIHADADIGKPKVFSAQAAMQAQNPFVTVRPYHRRLTEDIAADLFAEYDLIIDGTDNFDTRYLVNRAAVAAALPLISGAISQWEGQISTFDPPAARPVMPASFQKPPPTDWPRRAPKPVFWGHCPVSSGPMMAVEAVKEIAQAGEGLRGRLVIYDALYGESRTIAVAQRQDCPVCGEVS